MLVHLLRDPEAARKVFEGVLETPNGKRTLSRLARTCKALSDPALAVLWRDLDSLAPVIGLFPSILLKKARKPGLGLVKAPREEDWNSIVRYSNYIRKLTYDENANNVAPSIFAILDESRPQTYILPRLQELTWRAATANGLDRCNLFLSPELHTINLEVGMKFTHLNSFLADMSSRVKLTGFSFISPISLPDAFTELLLRQDSLERITLVAPGALSPGVGRWTASLPNLKVLQLDLTGRSMIAVEGFFDELRPRSGDSTPSSVGSTDSGVFSSEELDFSEIRKSALRLTGDLPSKGSFGQLKKLHLTGDVSNIDIFLKHIESQLTQLELVIEDPPDNVDWQDLSDAICERFGDTLQSLRVSATGSSRFLDLVRATSRAEPAAGRLSLEHFTSLPILTRLDIDLPESVIFTATDVACIAKACPNLETLRLCPLARFPQGTGLLKLTLEDLAPLIANCRKLHTLSAVIHAKPGSLVTLKDPQTSSSSLIRLHVGHSWISDPLQVAILLSHFAPRLENLKWFQEKNRPGYNEVNATNWQTVFSTLPHLQLMRSIEKSFVERKDIEIKGDSDITPISTADRGVQAEVEKSSIAVQCSPALTDQAIEAIPKMSSVEVDATLTTEDIGVDATPLLVSTAVDATADTESKLIETSPQEPYNPTAHKFIPTGYGLPTIYNLFSFMCRIFAAYPIFMPSHILHLTLGRFAAWRENSHSGREQSKQSEDSMPLDDLQVRR